jgi:hypothetical protein
MKISIDGKEIITLSEIQKKVIQNDIPSEIFNADMVRRLKWTVDHPCDQCYDGKKKEWNAKLKEKGVKTAPVNKTELAELVFREIPVNLDPSQNKDLVISVDDRESFRVTPTQKKMLKVQGKEDPDRHCYSQMAWILSHKYERCMERLRSEWEPRLSASGIKSVPTDDAEFAKLVFSQKEYKNRSEREKG